MGLERTMLTAISTAQQLMMLDLRRNQIAGTVLHVEEILQMSFLSRKARVFDYNNTIGYHGAFINFKINSVERAIPKNIAFLHAVAEMCPKNVIEIIIMTNLILSD